MPLHVPTSYPLPHIKSIHYFSKTFTPLNPSNYNGTALNFELNGDMVELNPWNFFSAMSLILKNVYCAYACLCFLKEKLW